MRVRARAKAIIGITRARIAANTRQRSESGSRDVCALPRFTRGIRARPAEKLRGIPECRAFVVSLPPPGTRANRSIHVKHLLKILKIHGTFPQAKVGTNSHSRDSLAASGGPFIKVDNEEQVMEEPSGHEEERVVDYPRSLCESIRVGSSRSSARERVLKRDHLETLTGLRGNSLSDSCTGASRRPPRGQWTISSVARRRRRFFVRLGGVLRVRRHRPLTRGEGVQVLEIQTDPRRWVQSDAGFPLRIRLDRPNLLLWLLVSGSRLYTGPVCVPTPSPRSPQSPSSA